MSVVWQQQILSPVFGLQRPIDLISVFAQGIHLSTPVCTLTFTSAFKCHVDIDKSEIIDAICDTHMHSACAAVLLVISEIFVSHVDLTLYIRAATGRSGNCLRD